MMLAVAKSKESVPQLHHVVFAVEPERIAAAAEEVAQRYGAQTLFRQHRGGEGFELDEIEVSVMGLPLTLLTTDLA